MRRAVDSLAKGWPGWLSSYAPLPWRLQMGAWVDAWTYDERFVRTLFAATCLSVLPPPASASATPLSLPPPSPPLLLLLIKVSAHRMNDKKKTFSATSRLHFLLERNFIIRFLSRSSSFQRWQNNFARFDWRKKFPSRRALQSHIFVFQFPFLQERRLRLLLWAVTNGALGWS